MDWRVAAEPATIPIRPAVMSPSTGSGRRVDSAGPAFVVGRRPDAGLWKDYRWHVIGASTVIVLQGVLIAVILAERRRRRVTQQALAERDEALHATRGRVRDLAGRLISAQEAERTRIARDLHDDVCQEVAGVAFEVCHLRHQRSNLQDADIQQALGAVQRRTADVAERLRLLSHDLHPTVLQHIGLVAAIEAHCAEVERQRHVQVTVSTAGDVEPVNFPAALSLFRIVQEALRNAVRHGHARRILVSLERHGRDLRLAVADDGEGFDPGADRQNGGLGLVSIEERARLARGYATIRSAPDQGTTIEVRVPITNARGTAPVTSDPRRHERPSDRSAGSTAD